MGASNPLEALIECALSLKDDKIIYFLVFGKGNKREEFFEQTVILGNITFVPKIKREQVQSVLSYCDVVYDSVKGVLFSRFGLSRNKWIDYMYSRKPMLISYNGYKTMVNEAENGYISVSENVVELKQKVLELSTLLKEQRRVLGKRDKDWTLKHRIYKVLAMKYLNLI